MELYILHNHKYYSLRFVATSFSKLIIANFKQIGKRKIIKIVTGKPDAGNVTEKSCYLENASCSAI